MPGIYRAECGACNHAQTMADQWMAVRLRSGLIEPLPHPLEDVRLEELGFTFSQARAQNRLLHYTKLACDGCGAPSEIEAADPRATQFQAKGGAWIWMPLVAIAIGGASITLLYDLRWYWTVLMAPGFAIMAVLATFGVLARIEDYRSRFRKQSPPKSDIECDRCGSGRLHLLGAIAGLSLPCPKCGQRRFVYGAVGIS